MVTPIPAWLVTCTDALRRLGDRPVTLFVLLLAVNALARPYQNCAHDARLYSLQVLNQAENGAFADDVFLRYGSQDQFSIFSRAVGPLAAAFGVRATFFVLYLVFNTLFLWGLFRFIRRLFPDPAVSSASLIFLVAADLFYGGHAIFSVHEQFFTPRLVATALVLHALDRLVAQRFLASFLLLAFGLVMHPLMAFGGAVIWAGYVVWYFLGPKVFAAGVAVSCGVALLVLAIPPLALACFGQMDDEWHEMVRISVLYNYPDAWSIYDWINHVLAFGLGIAAVVWLCRGDPVRAPFYTVLTLVALLGLAMTTIASLSPYALLFQGQPYRVVWILKLVQIPLGFLVIARWSQAPELVRRLVALGLAAFFFVYTYSDNELLLFLFAIPIAVFFWRFVADPVRSDWWYWAGITTFAIGAAAWMTYRWGFVVVNREIILDYYDKSDFVRLMTQFVPPAMWLLAAVLLFKRLETARQEQAFRYAGLCFALAIPSLYFGLDVSLQGRGIYTRFGADVAFVKDAIGERSQESPRVPTVYSSLGRAEYVWLDMHAASYFDVVQTAGVMFNRKTATELHRRINLVSKFELERLRKEALFITDDGKLLIERLYKEPFDGPPPTEEDLARLCADPGLDYVVIPQEFPGLYSAGNGRIFVYECNKVNKASSFSARREASVTSPLALQSGR